MCTDKVQLPLFYRVSSWVLKNSQKIVLQQKKTDIKQLILQLCACLQNKKESGIGVTSLST